MALSNFTELKAAIADWLIRDDLTAVIPSFIALAEAEHNKRIKHWRMEGRSTSNLEDRYTAFPTDWMATIRFELADDGISQLEKVSGARMAALREANLNAVGKPCYYAHVGGAIELFPTPDQAYPSELVYRAKITALSDAAPTNWLLTESPDAYLYGALVQAAPYLKDDARIPVWQSLHDKAIGTLNSQSEEAKHEGSGLRIRYT